MLREKKKNDRGLRKREKKRKRSYFGSSAEEVNLRRKGGNLYAVG